MNHARQSSDLQRLPLLAAIREDLRAGRGGQTDPLPPLPEARGRATVKREQALTRYYDRKAAYALHNLNSKGQPRRRRPNILPWDRAEHQRQYNLVKWHRRSKRMTEAGYTTRGTPRKYALVGRPVNAVAVAWQKLRAEMAIPQTDFLTPAERAVA